MESKNGIQEVQDKMKCWLDIDRLHKLTTTQVITVSNTNSKKLNPQIGTKVPDLSSKYAEEQSPANSTVNWRQTEQLLNLTNRSVISSSRDSRFKFFCEKNVASKNRSFVIDFSQFNGKFIKSLLLT